MTKFRPLKSTHDIFELDQELREVFTFNEFSEDIEFLRVPEWELGENPGKTLDDQDIIRLRYYISKVHEIEPQNRIVGDCCYLSAIKRSYHPVKKYIESVKWDGVPRCDEWLIKSAGCKDNIYTRMASSKFLIAAVNRVYNPGCKFDHMLILEGDQGIGKSMLVEEIAGNWYLDTNFGHKDKDLVDSMRGVFIVEISELSGMNKKDVDWLKSFLSKKVDRVRLPYAVRSKDFKRKCVFIGTYNPSGNNMYLRDDTGNRRFWPVECRSKIDIKYIRENKAQLWAEAFARFNNNEIYHINNEEAMTILSSMHEERELESPTYFLIKSWLPTRGDEVSMEQIIQECLKINMANKMPKDLLSIQTTVGIIMRKLKWEKGTNHNRNKYYKPNIRLLEPLIVNQPTVTEGDWDE